MAARRKPPKRRKPPPPKTTEQPADALPPTIDTPENWSRRWGSYRQANQLALLNNFVKGELTKGWGGKFHPLPVMLEAAVPLWQLELQHLSFDERSEIARESLDVLMQTGEAILYRIDGQSARAFNALAKGIAILSFQPGGVTCFGGLHFEATALTQC